MGLAQRLEQYTIKRPHEVLLITAEIAGEIDEILIFKGFSSSLVQPTAFDPDVPVLPDDAYIIRGDRLHGPYTPAAPRYIEQALTLEMLQNLLDEAGV